MTKVLVTGASGVLGTAVLKAFKSNPTYTVKGLAHSRPTDELEAVDLTDASSVQSLVASVKPDWVIHCAAERRPDVADKDPKATRLLNSTVPRTLAELSARPEHPFTLVYISTDYVFDGVAGAAPYDVDATTNPLQLYGETKLAGEKAILDVDNSLGRRVILRVPVLYGTVRIPSDSAVNILLDVVRDQSGKQYKMDHWATRYPTNVDDIARFLVRLSDKYPTQALPRIIHYSAIEPYTKYEICVLLAGLHKPALAHEHIIPDTEAPIIKPGVVGRPKDTHLSTRVIEATVDEGGLGMDVDARGFEEWWATEIQREAPLS